jgi:hypothetical protein
MALVLIGVIIGIVVTSLQRPAMAQKTEIERLKVVFSQPIGTVGTELAFVKDSKSGGCWALLRDNNAHAIGIASASVSACR